MPPTTLVPHLVSARYYLPPATRHGSCPSLKQEERVFVAGLSDEAGAGAGLGIAAHAAKSADPLSATLVATYVSRTLAGQKRDGNGQLQSIQQPDNMGIRAGS